MQAHNPGNQLIQSINEFAHFARKLPYIGSGAAFTEHGWTPTISEVNEFMNVAKLNNISFNFWEWYDARFVIPIEIWNAIAAFDGGNITPPTLPDIVRVTANVLNIRNAANPNAAIVGYMPLGFEVHVTGSGYDSTGKLWYASGAGYFASWYTVKVA